MTIEVGAIITFAVCFVYSLAAGYIENNNFRHASYIWFPFIAAILVYWLPNLDQVIHPEKYEGGWAWFFIIVWTIPGMLASLSALFLKWFIKRLSSRNRKS